MLVNCWFHLLESDSWKLEHLRLICSWFVCLTLNHWAQRMPRLCMDEIGIILGDKRTGRSISCFTKQTGDAMNLLWGGFVHWLCWRNPLWMERLQSCVCSWGLFRRCVYPDVSPYLTVNTLTEEDSQQAWWSLLFLPPHQGLVQTCTLLPHKKTRHLSAEPSGVCTGSSERC